MKFSTRMLLMSALLSVSFLATASAPTVEDASGDSDQVIVSAVSVAAELQFAVAIRTEEDMPALQRAVGKDNQRLPNPFGWQASTAPNQYQTPSAAANTGIGWHTQHRT